MAAIAATVPPGLTIEQKIEQAHDDISFILKSSTSLDDFMSGYRELKNMPTVSVLTTRIDDLFEKNGTTPRTITASDVRLKLMNQLRDIMSQKREDVAKYVLHEDGKDFTPKRLMCLFVCGLVAFRDVSPFENWMNLTKDNEIEYVHNFLLVIGEPEPRKIVVYSTTVNAVLTIDGEPNRKIPDTLFLTSSIPDDARNVVIMDSFPDKDPWSTLSQSIANEDVITSDPVLWYAYILQNLRPVIAFVDGTLTRTQCIGIEDREKDRKYIFAYDFPKYDRQRSPTDQGSLWRPYINEPCEAYANRLESFKPRLTADTAFISKYTYTNPMIIYIHVLVMALYGENRNFYACTGIADVGIENALVAGKTCEKYRELLEHVNMSKTALTIKDVMDENVMERLANAHLDLMRKYKTFTFNGSVIDQNYDDTLNATCPVKYDWVFRDEKLSKCAGWISKITNEISNIEKKRPETLDTDLGVFRRIQHGMAKTSDQSNELVEFIRKFERTVDIGAQVDDKPNKHIAVNLFQRGLDRGIFRPNSTLTDFLSGDESFNKAFKKYFVGEWHPDNVFGKYLVATVSDNKDKTHEVRDIIQMRVNNLKIAYDLSEVTTERAPSSGSSYDPSESGYNSDGSLRSMKSVGSTSGIPKKKSDSGNLPPINRRVSELGKIVETFIDENKREEGGIDHILKDLDSLATVDGKNAEDQGKKIEKIKRDMRMQNEESTKKIEIMKIEVEAVKKELQEIQEMAKKEKDELDGKLKTAQDDIDRLSQEIKEALAREAELVKEKGELDAKMKTLSGEKDALATEVARLTKELEDSQKKSAENVESIRILKEKVGEHEKEIARLTKEIEDMNTEKKKLLDSDASKQAELDALATTKQQLKDTLDMMKKLELEKTQLETAKQDLEKALLDDKGRISNEVTEKLGLMEDVRKLREEKAEIERQVVEITEKLRKGILEHERQVTTRIWKIHEKVDDSVRKKLTASELLALLKNKEYIKFLDAVKKGVGEFDKKEYNLPALFLIYESIGGTWSLFEKLADNKPVDEFMTEKLIESLRLFQTIETHNVHLLDTYTNQYFRKFLETFELLVGDGISPNFVIESF